MYCTFFFSLGDEKNKKKGTAKRDRTLQPTEVVKLCSFSSSTRLPETADRSSSRTVNGLEVRMEKKGGNSWEVRAGTLPTTSRIIPVSKWIVTHLELEQPYLGDFLTMVIMHTKLYMYSLTIFQHTPEDKYFGFYPPTRKQGFKKGLSGGSWANDVFQLPNDARNVERRVLLIHGCVRARHVGVL